MTIARRFATTALFCGFLPGYSSNAQQPAAAVTTEPAADKAHPAAMDSFQIPSHGEKLNAFVYKAAGLGPHPTVILLHGFPGNERNLDLAQAIRRSGWNVLYFDYRGSWGTPGAFSFSNAIEDTNAAIAYLRDPENAARLRSDTKNIVLVGHSMGGMMAAVAGAHDPAIRGVATISAANMAGFVLPAVKAGHGKEAIPAVAARLGQEGMYPLAGCTGDSLAEDLLTNAVAWNIPDLAPLLAPRPLLVVTSNDGLASSSNELVANVRALKGSRATATHLATDHSYSDQRIVLEVAVLNWLATLPRE